MCILCYLSNTVIKNRKESQESDNNDSDASTKSTEKAKTKSKCKYENTGNCRDKKECEDVQTGV